MRVPCASVAGSASLRAPVVACPNDGRLGQNANVNTTGVRRGRDGKNYPAAPLTRTERNRARWLAHNLVHRDGLSIRAAQQVMAGEHAIKRSVGIIARDLADYECPHCATRNT